MNILLNGDNSINCVSDIAFTVEYHKGLTLKVFTDSVGVNFPSDGPQWWDCFVDPATDEIITMQEYYTRYPIIAE
jgi:hypothetical protein